MVIYRAYSYCDELPDVLPPTLFRFPFRTRCDPQGAMHSLDRERYSLQALN